MVEVNFENFYELALVCKGQGFSLSPVESELLRTWYNRVSDKSMAFEALESTLTDHYRTKIESGSKNLSLVAAKRKVEKALGLGRI